MDLEEMQSDLLALTKLYGLLQISQDDAENTAINEFLDKRARFMLKSLLDAALGRVLETQTEILAAQSFASNRVCSLKPVQLNTLPNLRHSNLPKLTNGFENLTIVSKDKWSADKQTPLELVSELSRISTHSNNSGIMENLRTTSMKRNMMQYQSRKGLEGPRNLVPRPCMSTQRCFNKLSEAKENGLEPIRNNEKPCRKGSHDPRCNVNTVSLVACSSSPFATRNGFEKKSSTGTNGLLVGYNLAHQSDNELNVELVDFSKGVANSMRRIESQLSALKLFSDCVQTTTSYKAGNPDLSRMAIGSTIQPKRRLVAKSELVDTAGFVLDKTNLISREGSQRNSNKKHHVSGQSTNNLLTQRSIHEAGTMSVPKNKAQPFKHLLKINEPPTQGRIHNASSSHKLIKPMVQRLESTDGTLSQTSQYVYGLRVPQSQCDLDERPPLLPQKPSQIVKHRSPKATIGKVVKSRPSTGPHSSTSVRPFRPSQKKSMLNEVILKPTLLDNESQTWYQDHRDRNRSSTNSVRGPQAYQQESEETSSSTSRASSSWTSHSTSISDTEDSAYSSSSSQTQDLHQTKPSQATNNLSSSEESNSSYSDQTHYKDSGPPKPYRSSNPVKSKKPIGRLRNLRNKLGLILHHHHHHHHHHHDDNDGRRVKEEHKGSKWKHLPNIFYSGKNKGGGNNHNNKQAIDKSRKTALANVPKKNQVGHFHALVEGLMRHVKHSKKSDIRGPLARNSKEAKKLGSRQMFKQQGAKKGRVKIGFRKKRKQFGAVK